MAYEKSYVTLKIRDAYGRHTRKTVELASKDPTQMEIDANSVVAAYQAVMFGQIYAAIISGENTYAGAAQAGANVDTGVTVSCQLSGRSEKASLKWPTPDSATINADGTLDLSDLNVQAVEALYEVTTGVALLSDGESIEADGFISGSLDK